MIIIQLTIEYQHKPELLLEHRERYRIKGKIKDTKDWHDLIHCVIDREDKTIDMIIWNTCGYGDELLLKIIKFIYELKNELRINNYELIGTPRMCKVFKGEYRRYRF